MHLLKHSQKWKEVLSFLPWRLTEHLLPLRKFSKGEIKLTVSLNINFQIKLRDYPLSILRDYALSAYPTELERVIQNVYSYAQGKGVSLPCVCAHLYYLFSCYDSMFVLWFLVLFCRNATIPLFK